MHLVAFWNPHPQERAANSTKGLTQIAVGEAQLSGDWARLDGSACFNQSISATSLGWTESRLECYQKNKTFHLSQTWHEVENI